MTDVCTMCGDSGVDRWGQSCDCEWNTASGFVVRRLRVTDRVSFLSPAQSQMLGLFGKVVRDAWQEVPYQVGSSLVSGEIPRDIDVRVMISTEDFAQRFPGTNVERRHVCEQWRAQMMVWSDWGRHLTGLNIDFQVEPIEDANERFPTQERRPIGGRGDKPKSAQYGGER